MLTARLSISVSPPHDTTNGDIDHARFGSDEILRSPRSPKYMPDLSSLTSLPPFDHTRVFASPDHNQQHHQSHTSATSVCNAKSSLPPLPDVPLPWVWICHLCHSRYPLGVTRRCLVDGHYYCSGEAAQPNLRKKKKKQSCSSEFDYVAWREWGAWKRKALKALKKPPVCRGCENCIFPSQCRYPAEVSEEANNKTEDNKEGEDLSIANASDLCTKDQSGDHIMSNTGSEIGTTTMAETSSKISSTSTSNQNISFDQILKGIMNDNNSDDTTGIPGLGSTSSGLSKSQSPQDTKRKHSTTGNNKKQKKGLIPSVEQQMDREAERLRQLVGAELWDNLEEIDLEKTKC